MRHTSTNDLQDMHIINGINKCLLFTFLLIFTVLLSSCGRSSETQSSSSPVEPFSTVKLAEQMDAIPSATALTPSLNNTQITSTGKIVDQAKNVWTISGGQVKENGVAIGKTSGVVSLLYANQKLFMRNAAGSYYYWNGVGWGYVAIPPEALLGKYQQLKFYEDFKNPKTAVDSQNTQKPGFSLYPFTFFYNDPLPADKMTVTGKSFILNGDMTGYSAGVSTAYPSGDSWGGQAFGGGAYFEATISFDPKTVTNGIRYPAWWADTIEGLANNGKASQWPGAPAGYQHMVEVDFLETDLRNVVDGVSLLATNGYGGAIHEWFGVEKTTCPGTGFCQVDNTKTITEKGQSSPAAVAKFTNAGVRITPTDWSQPHRVGCLWIPWNPKTPTVEGYVQMYFDGVATADKITWLGTSVGKPYPKSPAALAAESWAFSDIDQSHYVPIIGTGNGDPLTVHNVQIWQLK